MFCMSNHFNINTKNVFPYLGCHFSEEEKMCKYMSLTGAKFDNVVFSSKDVVVDRGSAKSTVQDLTIFK